VKVIPLLLCLALTGAAPQARPAATGAFFALSVADVDASARWYAETLEMRTVMTVPKQDKIGVAVLEGSGLIVELIQNDAARRPAVKERVLTHGLFKAGAIVDDFDRMVAMLKARKVEIAYGPYPAKDGQRANVIVKDNEGNLIQFFGPR
jgi:catechol 2,3-dioxygenase-like lactoylglutathione lyase family enzyme